MSIGDFFNLPNGWTRAALREVCSPRIDQSGPRSEEFTYIDIASLNNGEKLITDPKRLSVAAAPSRARQHVEKDDVLVSMTRPNLNAVATVPDVHDGAIASTGFCVLRAQGVDPRWIFAHVRSPRFIAAMTRHVQGALYPAVRPADIRDYEIEIPPLNEQRRIVAKLDDLLSTSRAARVALDAVPALLEQFRQSILAAAFRGDLTADCRAADSSKKRKTDWQWKKLAELSERVSVGHVGPTTEYYCEPDVGVPFVRSQNVRPGQLRTEGIQAITPAFHHQLKKSQLQAGDVLIVRVGANRGDTCLVPEGFEQLNCANIVFARPKSGLSDWLGLYCQSPQGQHALMEMTTGSAQGVLNTASVAEMSVPVPPSGERRAIIDRVRALLRRSTGPKSTLKDDRDQLFQLERSIVAKAFRGDLVPQDPTDEPASVLLDRIRAERTTTEKKPARRAPRRSTSKAK